MINADRFRMGRLRYSVGHVAEGSWGSIVYRGTTAVAVLIVVLALGNVLYNMSQDRPLIPVVPLIAAGIIWLIGYGFRRLSTDH